jgi:two-component system, response regulator PdtaR
MSVLRLDAVDIARSAGLDEASNADEAIAIIAAEPNIHVVVFTDIRMPGSMHGLKLAKFIKDRRPPIGS